MAQGDVERQEARLREAVSALGLPEPTHVLAVAACGLSDKRRGLLRLVDLAAKKSRTDVAITYRGRPTRFGYAYREAFLARYGVGIHVVNGEEDRRSAQEELSKTSLPS